MNEAEGALRDMPVGLMIVPGASGQPVKGFTKAMERVCGGWVYWMTSIITGAAVGIFVPEWFPSKTFKVDFYKVDEAWRCQSNGSNGLFGTGNTPEEAARDFDKKWFVGK